MLQYETSEKKKYKGMFDCFRKIYAEEGVSGWYRVCLLEDEIILTFRVF